jgi:hypothetical protein
MPKMRFRAEQIVVLLRQIEVLMLQGKTPAVACREAGISRQGGYGTILHKIVLSSCGPQAVYWHVLFPQSSTTRVDSSFGLGDATTQRSKITRSEVSSLFWLSSGIGLAVAMLAACSPPMQRLYRKPWR